jgi:ferric-dicitrate binding protein FerR (iron transport regulator)
MSIVTVYMTADRFWELLSKKISAEASEDELIEFEKLVSHQPDWKNATEILALLWQQPAPAESSDTAEAFDLHVEKMKQLGIEFNQHDSKSSEIEVTKERSTPSKTKKWLLSATVLMIIVAGFFIFKSADVPQNRDLVNAAPISQVITESGSRTHIQLPDGSSVWLNASSDLTYDKEFGKNLREVNLIGEAFFDVVKDPAHPFIIHTKVIDVKVLGTQFNVKAYPNDAYTETSLIRGNVEVTVKNRPNEKHYLKPNEKVSVANNIDEKLEKIKKAKPLILTESLTYYRVDSTIIETSWVDNKLVFQENETFRDVALKMERWFGGITISFADDEVANYRIYGSFTNETITQALDALREAFNFKYKSTGTNIIISK